MHNSNVDLEMLVLPKLNIQELRFSNMTGAPVASHP